MPNFPAVALTALLAVAACAKSAGVETSSAPSPATSTQTTSTARSSGPRACPQPSRPDRRPTVAVMYFDNGAISNRLDYAPLSKGIADMLVVSLRSNCGIRVVEREQLQRILDEQNIPADRVDAATRVKIGKLLGAQHMIMGAFVVDPREQMAITASAVNVETSEHEADVDHRDAAKNLFDMIPIVAKKLNDSMKLPAMDLPVYEVPRPPKRDDELLGIRLYSRALEEQDRGNKSNAITLYRAALDKFPGYAPAQQALRKLQGS